MNEPIKDKFSFLNFIEEEISNLSSYDIVIDDILFESSMINCVKKFFRISDEYGWLNPDQKCTTTVKKEIESIFKDFFEIENDNDEEI